MPRSIGECSVVRTIPRVCGCKEDRRIDERTRHLLDVDAPGVVVARHIGRLLTGVAVEVGERARLLLDNVNSDAPVVFEMPAELITVVDIKLPPYSGGMFA